MKLTDYITHTIIIDFIPNPSKVANVVDVIELIKVIILGIVEGVTEFLPISSTGHLIVVSALIGFASENIEFRNTFDIFIQFGAVVAVALYYARDLLGQARLVRSDRKVQRFWLAVLIAFIPAAAIGFLFSDRIKEVLFNPTVVALSLIVGGVVFLLVERYGVAQRASTTDVQDVTPRQAGMIGVAQILALVPGVSRSGSSIVGGLFAGLDRRAATQFSFYLAIPTLGIATLYDLVKSLDVLRSEYLVYLLVGAVVSGIVAWLSIRWLLNFVSRNSFAAFGYYRILAGIVILLLVVIGRL
jgi:undecaprenyl-diphosphatase